jgi:hypothetical protein
MTSPKTHSHSQDHAGASPLQHPEEQPVAGNGEPRFGRLLIVLACALAVIIGITFASAAWFGL